MLETNIERLAAAGAKRIVVNVHHFAAMMKDYISSREWPTEVLASDESDLLLDTGGGLKHAEPLFLKDEPILAYNVDVLSQFSLEEMLHCHSDSNALVTLAVSKRETQRCLLFCNNQLVGWRNKKSGEELWSGEKSPLFQELAFSGIAVFKASLLAKLPPANAPYPIIPEYIRLARNESIKAFIHPASEWMDVGRPESLQAIN